MNLLLRLKPLEAHLDAFVKTKTMTDDAARSQCLDIWEEWQNIPEVSMVIYGKRKLAPKIDRGCGSCVSEALNSLIAWRNAQRATIPKISFQGVPDMSKPKAKVVEEVVTLNEPEPVNDFYESMKMHELRKLAKDHKVAYSNKTKASELIELIKQKVKAA